MLPLRHTRQPLRAQTLRGTKIQPLLLNGAADINDSILFNIMNKDIDAKDLCSELQAVARRLPKSMPPQEVLLFIVQQKLVNCVLNVFVALRILLTLPVSVASGGRSFSKLKLIKTCAQQCRKTDP